jgi:pyridoxine 5-phosphate synthase
MVKVAFEHKPNMSTLVPERREELTTEGGLDVTGGRDALSAVIRNLQDANIVVSVFIDADLEQVKSSHRCGAQRVELHTGRYCDALREDERNRELARISDAARLARKLGMGVAAGHGLNYQNVRPVAAMAEIDELNIGHAIVARAVLVGFERAVREMRELLSP